VPRREGVCQKSSTQIFSSADSFVGSSEKKGELEEEKRQKKKNEGKKGKSRDRLRIAQTKRWVEKGEGGKRHPQSMS